MICVAHFRPEFLNRLDETILFKPLNKDNIYHIIDLLVKDVDVWQTKRFPFP